MGRAVAVGEWAVEPADEITSWFAAAGKPGQAARLDIAWSGDGRG